MKKFCEIAYCESPGAKEVPVSVHKPSDQNRTFCAPCSEAYTIGCQHGRKQTEAREVWLVAIADEGMVVFVKAYDSEALALKGVASYLRRYHGYRGPLIRERVNRWLEEHEERLSVEVTNQKGIPEDRSFRPPRTLARVDRYLEKDRFILVAKNHADPSPHGPYEAWAYEGSLDLTKAFANCFGVGAGILDSLEALNHQLDHWVKGQSEEITKRPSGRSR